jgi:glycosyltransferase involved in cell wall biosynthesis
MKISIVIPNYNSGKYLSKCLESIFEQGYKRFEVIIVDAYSNDISKKTIEHYKRQHNSRFHVAYRRPQGQSDAINTGMDIATGDIVAYLCADDTYRAECFERVAKYFKSHSKLQWVYGRGKIIDSEGGEVRGFITKAKEVLQPRYNYTILQCVDYITQPTVFMRRQFQKQIGDFNANLKYVMDYEYWLRAGKISKPVFIDKHLACWRAHSDSTSVKEYKAEALQAFEVQRRYSGWWLRLAQWKVCFWTIFLYWYMSKSR